VVPPAAATRWVEALLPVPSAAEALASIGRFTGDPTRDLPAPTREAIRAKLADHPKLLALFDGEEARDQSALDRVFGEALPSGLVLQEVTQ
jgi:uncharacterized protein DUF3731